MDPTPRRRRWFSAIREPISELRAIRLGKGAVVAAQRGDMAECERLTRDALAIMESTFGAVLASAVYMNNLAGTLTQQGRHSEAEPHWRHALTIFEKELGPNHPASLDEARSLADALRKQGVGDQASETGRRKCAEAEALYRRLLDTHPAPTVDPRVPRVAEASAGSEQINRVRTLNDLAQALAVQGKVAEAELSYRQAIEIYEAVSGPDDPNLANLLGNLATHYMLQGNYATAEPLLRRAIAIFKAALGPGLQGDEPGYQNVAVLSEKLRHVLNQLGAEGRE